MLIGSTLIEPAKNGLLYLIEGPNGDQDCCPPNDNPSGKPRVAQIDLAQTV